MEILEYKLDANGEGNLIVPGFINHSDCNHFYNADNYTYVGLRLSPAVKVPDTVTKLTKVQLKVRNYTAGICMKYVDDQLVQMTNEEIDALVDQWCLDRGIE